MTAAVVAGQAVKNIPPVVTWVTLGVGVGVLYAAILGRSPRAELVAALTGSVPVRARKITSTADSAERRASGPTPITPAGSPSLTPGDLVPIGQGGHRLTVAAATAFANWSQQFGGPIVVSDSYRSYADQQREHDKDPARFAPPDKSAHPMGLAVDVDLGIIGADPGGTVAQRDRYRSLMVAALATGWCAPRSPGNGDGKEPWHFSFGGCR